MELADTYNRLYAPLSVADLKVGDEVISRRLVHISMGRTEENLERCTISSMRPCNNNSRCLQCYTNHTIIVGRTGMDARGDGMYSYICNGEIYSCDERRYI